MKTTKRPIRTAVVVFLLLVVVISFTPLTKQSHAANNTDAKGCVFLTLMGKEKSDSDFVFNTPAKVTTSIDSGLIWLAKAQQSNGGWGAGTHSRQDIMDPHAVKTDPATTAMVAMAILRSGSNTTEGKYSTLLKNSLNYLMECVENTPENATNITTETNTQIQVKLGANIDVILTSQFLSNMLPYLEKDTKLKERANKCLTTCVNKIQKAQDSNGSTKGSGWAGVLQSSLATNALESAQANGATVDTIALKESRDFQTGNYDDKSGSVNTDMGAGVVLYSVSSSNRAAAQDARKVQEQVDKVKEDGKLAQNAPVTAENLEKIGYNKTEAMKANTSYNVYNSTKKVAQDQKVMNGFGSNGGEEFLSYLQTGESMVINKDNDWKKWYENISGHLISIRNADGSWSGHHCISSPVFCTASCLLILSINNDIEKLTAVGKTK